MFDRTLARRLLDLAAEYPVVTVTGPRQSGKATLVRAVFPDHDYLNLELPHIREFARSDPVAFLAQHPNPVVVDEAQRVPDLFSYVQVQVDEEDQPGRFILTGSQNFLLHRSVSQTLAGRAGGCHLLPFSMSELQGRPNAELPSTSDRFQVPPEKGLWETVFTGFFPRIHDKGLLPGEWLANYQQTYLERDVRDLSNVGDLGLFSQFMALVAGRTGQELNFSSLAADVGTSHTTVRRWLSVLESSFQVLLVRPCHRNFNRRLVKRPKMYLVDTGLACHLLGIRSPDELATHSARGALFETYVVSEAYKRLVHSGGRRPLHFWRDRTGHEVDLLIDRQDATLLIEAKSAQTAHPSFAKQIRFLMRRAPDHSWRGIVVYGGDIFQQLGDVSFLPWWQI